MRGKRLDVPLLQGMQQQQPQSREQAELLQNFTIDEPSGAWDSRIGYERFFSRLTSGFVPWALLNRIDSVYYWSKRNGALDQILYESQGFIYALVDWNGGTYSGLQLLSVSPAAISEAPAQYCEFGKWLIITNGNQAPQKFAGWPLPAGATNIPLYDVGFDFPPPPPRPRALEPDPSVSIPSNGGESSIFLPRNNERGQGVGGKAGESNTFSYKISFISADNMDDINRAERLAVCYILRDPHRKSGRSSQEDIPDNQRRQPLLLSGYCAQQYRNFISGLCARGSHYSQPSSAQPDRIRAASCPFAEVLRHL